MAEAEQPDRLRSDREITVDDLRQLVASATPHFSYQLRNRVQRLIAGLPADSPVRRYGEEQIVRLQSLGFTGEVRGAPTPEDLPPLPSLSEHEQPRYIPGATKG